MIQVPKISGVVDLVWLQNMVAMLLLDDPRIVCPVVPEYKFLMDSDQSVDALWQLPQGAFTLTPSGVTINSGVSAGLVGAGLLVEMPTATTDSPGVSGPPATWHVTVVAFEERNTNWLPQTGTCVAAEQYCELVVDILQNEAVYKFGTFQAERNWMTPAHDRMTMNPTIIALRATVQATVGRTQTKRTPAVAITFSAGNCALLCADGAAAIYYTVDGSAPVRSNTNPDNAAGVGASLYAAPFAVASGTVLAAARNAAAGTTLSAVAGATAP